MRANEFFKSCENVSRDLDPHLVEIAKASFEADHARKYYAPAFFLELYPYLHLFGEHDSFENVDCDNKDDRSKAMKAIFSRLRDSKIDKYRASLLGWLSQVHTEVFFEFIQENDIAIRPLTQPVPFLKVPKVSWGALRDAQKRRDDRLKETGWVEPVLKSNSATEQSLDTKGFVPENSRAKSNHLPLVMAGFVGIVFLIWTAWSFTGDTGKVAQTEIQPTTNVETAINAPTEENSANNVTEAEADEVKGDLAQAQDETDNIIEVPETPTEPVWDEITDREWSVGKLLTIRRYVQRASLSDLQKAADDGNINAATLLAFAYHFGELGLPHDFAKEREYARPACQEGQARACMLVGVNFSTAESHGNDNEMASIFYRRACNLGSGIGCLYTGQRFQSGFDGVKKDKNAALVAYDTACKEGISSACQSAKYIRANPASIMTSEYAWRQSDGKAFTSEGVAVGWYKNGYIVDDNGNVIAKVE